MVKKILFLFLLILNCFLFSEENPEEIFKRAKSEFIRKDFVQTFEYLAEKYPDHFYGQLSFLELAKVKLLERKYEDALMHLKKIRHSEIEDKEFWMAKAYLKNNENDNAIVAAQNFIFTARDNQKIEESYFIIAEAYLNDKIYQRALNTLESLRTSKYIANHIPLLHYKIGFCNEQMGKHENALRSYQKLKMDFPYDQYSYLAEDRINNLIRGNQFEIDLNGFEIVQTKKETNNIIGKTNSYLQAGAFGSEKNAENFRATIESLGFGSIIFTKNKNGKILFVVAAGPFENNDKLQKAKKTLETNNIDSFVIKR